MQELLARYLDRELTEEQATDLLRATDERPEVAAELRLYEAILDAAEELPRIRPPEGFVDRIMDRVVEVSRPEAQRSRPGGTAGTFGPRWLAAAAILVGVLIGYLLPSTDREPAQNAATPSPASAVFLAESLTPSGPGVRPVVAIRLDYVSRATDVKRVSVAGSFNGWDPGRTPLRRKGDVWTILLVLPPGVYEYMLIENGERWITDPSAPRTRDDGFGDTNGILEIRS